MNMPHSSSRLSDEAARAGNGEKLLSMQEAAERIAERRVISFGGATLRRKPVALVAALVGTGASDLHLQSWLGSFDVDVLVGSGLVAEVDCAYTGFGPIGLPRATRRAVETGRIAMRNWSEGSFVAAVRAAGQGIDMALNRSLLGTSMAEEIGTPFTSPYSGLPMIAVPALAADVAVLHAQAADRWGNVYRRRPNTTDDIDALMAAAATSVIVSVEEIIDFDDPRFGRDDVVIPGLYVDGIVHAPGGARPTACDGVYPVDLPTVQTYLEASVTDDGVREWARRFAEDGLTP